MTEYDSKPRKPGEGTATPIVPFIIPAQQALLKASGFQCPNGCGVMNRTRCKLSCPTCLYFDDCSSFC